MQQGPHPFSLSVFILFETLLVLPLLFRPFPLRGYLVFPVLFALYCRIITSSTYHAALDWSLALAITPQLLKALDVLLLTNAERSLRRLDELEENPKSFNTFRKLCWALELMSTPRGIGWNWEVPYICYAGTSSRRAFVRSRLQRAICYYLLLDLLQFSRPNLSRAPIPVSQPLSTAALVPVWSWAVGVYLQLWLVHTVPATIIVCCGLGEPSSYPYVMGPLGFMSSLRCFWGRTWHQNARRMISALGLWLRRQTDAAPQGSRASAYIQLSTGFAVSGATHAIAGIMAGKHVGWRDPTGAMPFFCLQLMGVLLEDGIFEILLAMGVVGEDWRRGHMDDGRENYGIRHGWWRCDCWSQTVGYLFVVGWLSVTMPAYVEGLRRTGILEPNLVPFSLVTWATNGTRHI